MPTPTAQVGYLIYATGRRILRATGLVKVVRRHLGRSAAKLVYRLSANGGQPLTIHGHKMLLAPPGDYASPDMVADQYEIGTSRLFEQLVKPGHVVLDVGAHVGYYTLLAARLAGPAGTIYAFEPAPGNHALLLQNIALNGYHNIRAVETAVTDHVGRCQLFLSHLDNGFHSLLPLGLPEPSAPQVVEVAGITLDQFLAQEGWPYVDLLKMDIEGGELAAFHGMQEFLVRSPHLKLIIEFCPWILQTLGTKPEAFLAQLQEMGFRLSIIRRDGPQPLETLDLMALIQRLQERDGYTNLLGIRQATQEEARRPTQRVGERA